MQCHLISIFLLKLALTFKILQTKQNISKKNLKHAKLTKKAVILKMQLLVIVQILEYFKIRTNYVNKHEQKQ